MDPKRFYGHYKRSQTKVKPVGGCTSDDIDLASDSEEDVELHQNLRTQENIIIPESDTDENEEVTGNHHQVLDDASDEGNDNAQAGIYSERRGGTADVTWKVKQRRQSQSVQPWKGRLPDGTNCPDEPINYFRKLLDEDVLNNVVNESNLYAASPDPTNQIQLSLEEIEQFIGCCFYMSIYGLPGSRMYWKEGTRVPAVADTMTRNRWEQIKSNLHFNNNENVERSNDKLYKIRPFLDSLVKNFNSIPMNEKLCVDEQMIPFKGRHNLKQYMKNKPKKWGYKAFVLCDSFGIVHNFELYSGAVEHDPNLPDVGISGNVVLRLTQIVPRNHFHKVYFDNWFTSIQLQVELAKIGILSIGTVRPNRLRGCKFSSDKDMKQQGRGTVEEATTKIDGISLTATKWYDNKAVHLLSTFVGVYPTTTVQRWDRKEKAIIDVQCPSVVIYYNKFMGGVDLMDSLIALYRTTIRSKKWYHRIVFHLLDLTVVNAWLLYRRDCRSYSENTKNQVSLRDFKVSVAACQCQEKKGKTKKRGRPSSSSLQSEIEVKKRRGPSAALPDKVVRKDEVAHWPYFSEKRGRCKKPKCGGTPKVVCSKCKVYLCFTPTSNFFLEFHTT